MTSSMTLSGRGSSVGRSTSLPNVVVSEENRQRRAIASHDPPLRFYSGSLRHKDSIILRKSKLRQVQPRPSGERRSSDEGLQNVAMQVVDGSDSNFDDRSKRSPRPELSPYRSVLEARPGNTRVVTSWTGGTWLPELQLQNCREPTSSRLLSRRRCSGNGEVRCHRNSTNKLTVILSAVDLPHASHSPFRCECQASLGVRCLPNAGWKYRGVATTQYLSDPLLDGSFRTYPGRTWWRSSALGEEKFQSDAGLTSSSPSPEPFPRHGNSSAGDDSPVSGHVSQSSGAPVVMTSQRRVYELARAYSDRVRQLQHRSTTTHDADDFVTADVVVPVHRARARSVSAGRRTTLPLSAVLKYR